MSDLPQARRHEAAAQQRRQADVAVRHLLFAEEQTRIHSQAVTKDEKKHLSRVAELGCAVCRRMGYPGTPAEIHHKRAGTGAGRRSSHWEAIPLCPEHHRGKTGIHGLGTKGFPKHWGFDEADLLAETLELLNNPTN